MTLARSCSIVVLAITIVFAACGGSSKKADPAADLAVAKGAVLTAADLPGYKSTPHQESGDIPAKLKADFASCLGVKSTIFDETPGAQKANSPDFSKGANDEQQVSNTVQIDPTKSTIDEEWKQISKPETAGCLQKLFEGLVKAQASQTTGVTFHDASVTQFDVGVGSRSVGYSVKFAASVTGSSDIGFYADVIYVPRDRAGLEFDFFNIGSPFDRAFETSLVKTVYDRIGDNAK